jgi:hypothetical protein
MTKPRKPTGLLGRREERGAIAALSAIVMIAVIGSAGLAVDLSRIWLLSARLKTAVDASSLVAARTIDSPTRDADTRALFWANMTRNGTQQNYVLSQIQNASATPEIERVSDTRIRVSARATIPTTLFSIISPGTTQMFETTLAEREGSGLELAIVIDQTSSMRASAPGFASKLAAAQNAARTMLDILYGTDDTRRNLWVSVVPFSRAISFGPNNTNFLNTAGLPPDWNVNNWSGCVEARGNGNDITDISPATIDGRFRPYFDQSTYRRVGFVLLQNGNAVTGTTLTNIISQTRNQTQFATQTAVPARNIDGVVHSGYTVPLTVGANACTTANAYTPINVNLFATAAATTTTAYTVAFCRGDNDFMNPNGLSTTTSDGLRYNPEFANLRNAGMGPVGNLATSSAGPNRLCTMNQILPLTASRATVQAAIDAIQAPIRSGGTTTAVGMQGAWYTLSPQWQNWWPDIATNGGALGALPLAYNTRNMNKAVVLLSDGDNNWQSFYTTTQVRGSPTATELLYNAYGRVADWNANFPSIQINPVNQTNADARLDTRFVAICQAMKGTASTNPNDHRIRIYVVGFEVANSTHRTLLQNCASGTSDPYYFEAPTASALQGAFSQIANALTQLRLVE